MRRDQKKQQKQKKREQKNAEQKRYAERIEKERRRRDQYPKILFDSSHGAPEFVEQVRRAIAAMDFDDPGLFHDFEREFYKLVRERGSNYALRWAEKVFQDNPCEGPDIRLMNLLMGFGSKLLERIPVEARRRLMPYSDVHVDFSRQDIVLRFSSLLSEKGTGGTLFYSRRRPTVEFDGKKWGVAFSRHAVERICERINPRYIEYGAAGDVHSWFAHCIYFEPILLHGDQPAFILYGDCLEPPFLAYHTYVEKILGKENVEPTKGKCYYRVGYCPIAFEGEFAKAKTLLFPGYTGTPEYGLILKSKLNREERELLIQEAKELDANEVILNFNHATTKWFHDNGVLSVGALNHHS